MIELKLFLLLALFAVLYSVAVNGTNSKRGCLGDAIELFQNISFNSSNTIVSIYKNTDSSIILAMWQIKNDIPTIINGQSDRMSLDKKGNIWILNLQESDEGTYAIKIERGGSYTKQEMSLVVLAAPTKKCKPKILSVDNSLIAQVKGSECGRPTASVYWLDHPGIFIERDVIKLKPGGENGIYHACIEGDALLCAKISNLSDYCSVYNYSGITTVSSESSDTTIGIRVMISICMIMLTFLFVKKIIAICQRWKKKMPGKWRADHRKNRADPKEGELELFDTGCNTGDYNPEKIADPIVV